MLIGFLLGNQRALVAYYLVLGSWQRRVCAMAHVRRNAGFYVEHAAQASVFAKSGTARKRMALKYDHQLCW